MSSGWWWVLLIWIVQDDGRWQLKMEHVYSMADCKAAVEIKRRWMENVVAWDCMVVPEHTGMGGMTVEEN